MPENPIDESAATRDANRDPITGEPGSHPVGTGVGALAAGAAGAAIGAVAGPIGSALGAAIGAVAGGLAGSGVAERIDPTEEDAHWRERHAEADYADKARSYEDYMDAYRTGYTGYRRGETFAEREADLRLKYEEGPQNREANVVRVGNVPSESRLRWADARRAVQAAYDRVQSRDKKPGVDQS